MIVEFFLGIVTWIGGLLIGMLPEDDSAELVGSASGIISTVVSNGSGISVWFPWAIAGVCAIAVAGAWAATFAFKVLRQLLTHIPFFGGTG